MSIDEFADVLRTINLVMSLVLLVVTTLAVVWRWKRLDPIERLFSMGLEGYVIYVSSVTWYGLQLDTPFRWYVPVLTISNVWLITAVAILTLRTEEPEHVPPAVATSEGWDTLTEDVPDRPEPT